MKSLTMLMNGPRSLRLLTVTHDVFATPISSSALTQASQDTAFLVSKVSLPPCGIASRAMTARRLRIAVMSGLGSTRTRETSVARSASISMCFAQRGPQQTGRIGKQCIDVEPSRRLRWPGPRAKASRFEVRLAPRAAASAISPAIVARSARSTYGLRQDFDRSAMTVRMLLKSWTTPPVS